MGTPRELLTSPIGSEPEPERGPGSARLFAILAWGIAAGGLAYLILEPIADMRAAYGERELPRAVEAVLYLARHPGSTLVPFFAIGAIPLFRIRTPAHALRLAAIYLAAGVFAAVLLLIIAHMPLVGTPSTPR